MRSHRPEVPTRLLQELRRMPPAEVEIRLANGRSYADSALAELLLEEGYALRFADPEQMTRLTRWAVVVAGRLLPREVGGERQLADLRGRAHDHLGNAHRVGGRIAEAERAFAIAATELDRGTGAPDLRARHLSFLASLRIFQRRFLEAARALDQAQNLFACAMNDRGRLACLVQRGQCARLVGRPGDGIEPLRLALSLIRERADRDLLAAAAHNLVYCLIDMGLPRVAHQMWLEVRPVFERSDELAALRFDWLRGVIDVGLGFLDAAEVSLTRCREAFARHRLLMEAGMVSLDLAGVYAQAGRRQPLVTVLSEALPMFQAVGAGPETLATVSALVLQAERGALESSMIAAAARRVQEIIGSRS